MEAIPPRPVKIAAVLAFTASGALYSWTAAPDLGLVDSAELALAAATGGIAHPPGVPLFLLVGRVFAAVPLAEPVRMLNLMSAFFVAAAVAGVLVVTERVLTLLRGGTPWRRLAAAQVAAAAFATAWNPWEWSSVTEVYALNLAFSAGLLLLAAQIALRRTGEPPPLHIGRRMALFGLLLGLGLGNHLTLLAVALPALVWIGSAIGWRRVVSPWAAAGLILGLAASF